MSKRLEQMEHDYKNAFPINIEWLLNYAKEQAERVEGLEGIKEANIEELGYVDERLLEAEQQNKRYREAIEKAIEMISVSTGTITKPKEIALYDAWEIKNTLLEALEETE